jgi:pimeloyl-ACP methyl ester carboxylesterase
MSSITVMDGTEIYYKDWGTGQPIMFHHGWPLSADDNWWRQGMMGGTKAQCDCIKALSETDLTEDLKKITVPVLVMHSEDDQIVPFADSGPLAAKLLKNGTLKVYQSLPHGMPTTHADQINVRYLLLLPCNSNQMCENSVRYQWCGRERRRCCHFCMQIPDKLHREHRPRFEYKRPGFQCNDFAFKDRKIVESQGSPIRELSAA